MIVNSLATAAGMTAVALGHYLAVSAILFVVGLVGFLSRRNMIIMFLCTELMFQAAAIAMIVLPVPISPRIETECFQAAEGNLRCRTREFAYLSSVRRQGTREIALGKVSDGLTGLGKRPGHFRRSIDP